MFYIQLSMPSEALIVLVAAMVSTARELLGTELAALVGESYDRAYGDMVRVQQLTELEEVIAYTQAHTSCAALSPHTHISNRRQFGKAQLFCGVSSSVYQWYHFSRLNTVCVFLPVQSNQWFSRKL